VTKLVRLLGKKASAMAGWVDFNGWPNLVRIGTQLIRTIPHNQAGTVPCLAMDDPTHMPPRLIHPSGDDGDASVVVYDSDLWQLTKLT
jgi:hypothetical protein